MQRYRVNYVLLIGLVVGFFAFSGASYALWKFQVNRNATYLLEKAKGAEAEGRLEDAYKSLHQYVRLRRTETDAWKRLGEAAVKVLEQPQDEAKLQGDAYRKLVGEAYGVLVMAVRETGDDGPELRRKLVDQQIRWGMSDLAYGNITQLIQAGHVDPELRSLEVQCLFRMQRQKEGAQKSFALVGYDEKADQFDAAKALAADKPIVYAMLGQHLRSAGKQSELADRVVEQMVAANPESAEAHLLLYQFQRMVAAEEQLEQAKSQAAEEAAVAALEKAYELDPTDAGVLSAKGNEAIARYQKEMQEAQGPEGAAKREAAQAHLHEAAKYIADALERYPDRVDFIERVARIKMMLEQTDEALTVLDEGLKKFTLRAQTDASGIPLGVILVNLKMEILIAQTKFDQVVEQAKSLRQVNNTQVKALADFFEARVAAIQEKWAEAARTMHRVKPLMLSFPEQQALAGAVQGFCHTKLGQYDLARAAYKFALARNPQMPQAKAGLAEVESKLYPIAEREDDAAPHLDQRIREMLSRPKAEQDWNLVFAEIDKYIDDQAATRPVTPQWVESRKQLLRGQVLVVRAAEATDEAEKKSLFQQARAHITKAFQTDRDDPTIQLAAIRLIAQEPGKGPANALQRLDEVVKTGKDSAQFRIERINLLFALRDEKLPEQLDAATQGLEEWSAAQQAMVWSAAGTRFEQLGRLADAQRCLEKAAELDPQDLPTRMALFDLAMRQNNDAQMRKAQEGILAIVKSPSDPDYVLTEVKRRIAGQETGASTAEELKEARTMLEAALKVRPTWAELHVAQAQLVMLLDNNPDAALASLNSAMEQGGAGFNAIVAQIRLLAERGRLREAREAMKRIPEQAWSAALGDMAANILLNVGEADRAFAEAEKVLQANPENAPTNLWFADIALKANKPEQAETAMKKAVALTPGDPDLWTRLVSFYIQLKRPDDIERTLREAHLALDAEYLPLLTAKYYELQMRWQEAEDIYLAALDSRLDEVSVARRLAEFYLLWATQDASVAPQAAPHLNRILKASYEGRLPPTDDNAVWARRQAARLLSASGSYRDWVKAERLLTSAAADGQGRLEDESLLVDILAQRSDPASRERAVALLRQAKQRYGSLKPERELQLGHALFELGDWAAAKEQMTKAAEQYPDHLGLKTAYVSMLIHHKEFGEAERSILRLDGVEGAAAPQAELRLRLAGARGDKSEVRRVLTAMTPDTRVLTPEQLQSVRALARLAETVGDHEYSLKLMQVYAGRAQGGELDLARLTSLYGDLEQGLDMLRQLTASDMEGVLSVAIELLRARRSEAPEKLDEEVNRLVRQALRDDPESAKRMMVEAEVLDVQEKYDQSIAAYRKLLERDDVPPMIRAAAANNMAFIVALKEPTPENLNAALAAVNEAIELLGPLSDILDTRALIYLAQKQYDQAAEDMRMAVKMNATPLKYFHLAAALAGTGDAEGAKAAWDRAKQEGLNAEEAPKLERPALEAFSRQMDGVAPQAKL